MVVYSLFGISGSGIIRFRVQNVPMWCIGVPGNDVTCVIEEDVNTLIVQLDQRISFDQQHDSFITWRRGKHCNIKSKHLKVGMTTGCTYDREWENTYAWYEWIFNFGF